MHDTAAVALLSYALSGALLRLSVGPRVHCVKNDSPARLEEQRKRRDPMKEERRMKKKNTKSRVSVVVFFFA